LLREAQRRHAFGAFPCAIDAPGMPHAPPPSPTLPRRKSGLPDLREISRDPGRPGARGGGSTPSLLPARDPPHKNALQDRFTDDQ
jgi:hypothetical protein